AVLGGGDDDAPLVPGGADPAERHGEAPPNLAAPPGVSLADERRYLCTPDIPGPAHLGGVAAALHPGHHLPDVSHGPALEREAGYLHDGLVTQFQRVEAALAAPHLRGEFPAAHHRGHPGMPRRLVQERVDRAWPGLRVADRITTREHHPGHHPVTDAGLPGGRPDDALVVAESEVAEGVPFPLLAHQIPDQA